MVFSLRSPLMRRDAVERSIPISFPHSVKFIPMLERWAARNSCGVVLGVSGKFCVSYASDSSLRVSR